MLQLLVGEAHQGFELGLIAEPVVAADVENLGADEPFGQATRTIRHDRST
ncbi:MAG: hypothetical protein H7125_13670 [Proteobacteria bacterium]|nr:hypothetical protein [Burkholderiales bacterium]